MSTKYTIVRCETCVRCRLVYNEGSSHTCADIVKEPTNKYQRVIKGITVDIYDILTAYRPECPAIEHAVKKLLCTGKRGHKSYKEDLEDAKASINRALELYEQHNA